MSDNHTLLAKPNGDERISERALGYVSASLRMEMHQLVLKAFHDANISQATLAKRLRKRPEQISRLLSGPGNWTIDTAAQLLFAIDGSLTRIEKRWPQLVRRSNYRPNSSDNRSATPSSGSSSGSGAYSVRQADEHVF